MASGPITSWQIDGETVETVADFILLGSKITADSDCSHEIKRCLLPGRKVMTNLDSVFKSRDITLPTEVLSSQGYGFSSGHVWMWELDYKENWALKNWYLWTVVLEKILESPLRFKNIQPVHPKGYQSWVFIGRTDVEAKTPTLCNPMDCRTSGLPVHHQLLEFTQTRVYRVSDAIQPSHPLSSPSPAPSPSQHQSLFQWVNSVHEVAKVLELQL